MDRYKFEFTKLQMGIMRFLTIKAGESFSQRQIAENVKVSPTAISKSLPLLKRKNLIKIDRSKKLNLNLVSLNRDSREGLDYKRTENMKLIFESGLSKFLEETFPGTTIILFGSYSLGTDTTKSDIDIAVIRAKPRESSLKKFEKSLERQINIQYFSSLKRVNNNLRENILNGIVLAGAVEL